MKQKILSVEAILSAILLMSSCAMHKKPVEVEMPVAINTINTVSLKELNLQHGKDYVIMNTATAEASVIYSSKKKGKHIVIEEENGEFKIDWKMDEDGGKMYRDDYEGIARFGFLNNDYVSGSVDLISPEYTARNLAIYRLISIAKVNGADGIIEPIISTSAEDRGSNTIVFKTTVSAKLMKLVVDVK